MGKKYERKAMQDESGKYIYPDLHQHSFWLDEKAEADMKRVMAKRKWTMATLVRVALEEYVDKVDGEELDDFASRL